MNNAIIKNIIDKRIPCIFVSPHLDDAVLSAGGLMAYLAKHTEVEVVNVFTQPSPRPYTLSAKAFLDQCGYTDAVTLFEDRKKEDIHALATIGVKRLDLGFTDALWRRITAPSMFRRTLSKLIPEFAFVYPIFRLHIASDKISKHDAELMGQIGQKIKDVASKYETCYVICPLAIRTHIDHVIVRDVCRAHFEEVIFWTDFPYHLSNGVNPESVGTWVTPLFTWMDTIETKRHMIEKYTSQVKAMFPDDNIELPSEQYYRPIP